jgi:hypothetical protein
MAVGLAEAPDDLDQGRDEIPVHHRDAEQLAQLSGDDAEGDAVEEADQDRPGEEVHDEAHAVHAADHHQQSRHDGQGGRELQVVGEIALGQGQQQGGDHGAGGRVRPQDQLPGRAEQGIDQHRQHAGVQTDFRREARQVGIGDRRGDLDRGDREAGDDIPRQPLPAVKTQVAKQRNPVAQHHFLSAPHLPHGRTPRTRWRFPSRG